jgi:hypothetical protein
MEQAAQQDLIAVLRLFNWRTVRADPATGQVTAAGARSVAASLEGGDFYALDEPLGYFGKEVIGPIKAFAWPLILQNAGLVEIAIDCLRLTEAGRRALSIPPHETLRRAWMSWQETTLLDELNRIKAIEGQTGEGKAHLTATPRRRAAITAALRGCPAHAWIAVDEFLRVMRAAGHTFYVTGEPWTLYIGDKRYGRLDQAGPIGQSMIQGRYAMALLLEYAATLGLIDVAYMHPARARDDYHVLWGSDVMASLSRYDGLLYFRINRLGAWCLGQVEHYTPPENSPVLKVLPTMDVAAVEHVSPGDVLFLEQIAAPTSDASWTIRQEKVLNALETGLSVDEIAAFLKVKSDSPLPGNVTVFLTELGTRMSRLVAQGLGTLIEAQDAALAQRIANDSRMRSLCMLAGERHLVVPEQHESAFRRALHAMGYGISAADGRAHGSARGEWH